MAEISRKESKSAIKKWLGCNDCDTGECLSRICVECKNHYDEDEFRQALEKAISDTEKLEKIEHILFPRDNMCGGQLCATCDYEGGVDCVNERQIDLCKQILRGGE